MANFAAIVESATARDAASSAATVPAATSESAAANDSSAFSTVVSAKVVEAASGQDQAGARFDGVAAQVDAASAADIIAALPFAIIAAMEENATANDRAGSYLGVVNLARKSLDAVAQQDATSIILYAVTEMASAVSELAAIRWNGTTHYLASKTEIFLGAFLGALKVHLIAKPISYASFEG